MAADLKQNVKEYNQSIERLCSWYLKAKTSSDKQMLKKSINTVSRLQKRTVTLASKQMLNNQLNLF